MCENKKRHLVTAGENRCVYLQEVSQHRCHTDVQRLQTTAASRRDEEDISGHGTQMAPEVVRQVTTMDVHDHRRLQQRLSRSKHVGFPHLHKETGSDVINFLLGQFDNNITTLWSHVPC